MQRWDVVIVGAGHAGAQAAIALRQFGFDGSVALVTDEDEPPYERPPLSKEYLAGEKTFDRILIRPPAFWSERQVDVLLATRVTAVDAARKILSAPRRRIAYGTLVWAAGGRARTLSCAGASAPNVFSVRRRSDVDAIRAQLDRVEHATVVGGGYIGLESAAALRKLGKRVTVLEALDRVLARVAGPELSRFYEDEHRAHGVDLRTGAQLARFDTSGGRASAAVLADGARVRTDMAIVGVGIVPETDALEAAGAVGGNGIHVDEYCRTSLQDVYAIGDCASHHNRYAGSDRLRLESVQNANDQAKTAAAHIVGRSEPYTDVPWFWSTQYDLSLKTVGLSLGYDRAIVRGRPSSRSFSVLYTKAGRLIALDCVNAMKDYAQGRALVVSRARLDLEQAADSGTALKDVATAGAFS